MDKAFSLKNQTLLLTYKTHIDKGDLEEFLDGLFNYRIEGCYIAHEMGDKECNYEHTHVAIRWEKAIQTKDSRKFDYDGIHPHIKPAKGRNGWSDIVKYVSKEDPELVDTRGGLNKRPLVNDLLDKETLSSALELATKWSDVGGIIGAYGVVKRRDIKRRPEPHKWQSDMRELLRAESNGRQIYWIRGRCGNEGKTAWTRNIWLDMGALVIRGGNRKADVALALKNHLDAGYPTDVIIFDLTRRTENRESIYDQIEELRDGCMMSGKYNSTTIWFDPGHLVVFANWDPICNELSDDRWTIFDIVKDESGILTLFDATSDVMESQEKEYKRADGKIICFD